MVKVKKIIKGENEYDFLGNAKVFTLSSTSDYTTAELAFKRINDGNVAFIKYNNILYSNVSGFNSTGSGSVADFHASINDTGGIGTDYNLRLHRYNSNIVSSILVTDRTWTKVNSLPSNPNANTIYFIV